MRGTVIDYMHGILLGVTKTLLHLWIDNEHKGERFYIGNKVASVLFVFAHVSIGINLESYLSFLERADRPMPL